MKKDNAVNELQILLSDLLLHNEAYHPMVSEERQLQVLDMLDNTIANENFYFVFNLQTCKIESVGGVKNWLGYPNQEFTVDRYLKSVHPSQSLLFNIIAHSMYKALCKGIFKLKFGGQRYVSFISLKHYDGSYQVFKKSVSVFQYDKKNRLLAQLNEFTKMGDYEGDPLKPRILEAEGAQKEDFERMVFKMCLESFMEGKHFSKTEFVILKHYANHAEMNRKKLAAMLKVELSTIETLNRRILEKARDTFTSEFQSVKDVALYLRQEKIL